MGYCMRDNERRRGRCAAENGYLSATEDTEDTEVGRSPIGDREIADFMPSASPVMEIVHQMRSKFFSISRRVNRSITGRPCGHTVEYAVALSSSRMCVIFSYVSG